MDSSEWSYMRLNKFLLKCFGLWPYQSKFAKRSNYAIFIIWTSLIVLPLVEGLVTLKMDSVRIYGTILGITYIVGTVLVGTNFYARSHWVDRIIKKIQFDLSTITDPKELAIMKKFNRHAQLLSLIHMAGALSFATLFVGMNYLPCVYATDEEYSKMFTNYPDHWIVVDNLRRFQISIHIGLETFYSAFMYIATTAIYTCGVNHTCGMYAIVSYRLKKLMKNKDLRRNEKTTNKSKVTSELLDIIAIHREAIKSTHIVGRTFNRTIYALQIGALLLVAILLCALQLGVFIKNYFLAFKGIAIATIFIGHIFYMNYGGQQIIEYSNKIFSTTYLMKWYLMSTSERKILFMIILRTSKCDRLSAGAMTLTLRDFTNVISFSWSMATVLLSKVSSRVLLE